MGAKTCPDSYEIPDEERTRRTKQCFNKRPASRLDSFPLN